MARLPASPPFPTCCSLEFQPAAGSQTSKTICESDEGLMTPVTRHDAGRPASCGPPGTANVPAGIDWADVIMVFGRGSVVRLSQLAPSAVPVIPHDVIANATAEPLIASARRCPAARPDFVILFMTFLHA